MLLLLILDNLRTPLRNYGFKKKFKREKNTIWCNWIWMQRIKWFINYPSILTSFNCFKILTSKDDIKVTWIPQRDLFMPINCCNTSYDGVYIGCQSFLIWKCASQQRVEDTTGAHLTLTFTLILLCCEEQRQKSMSIRVKCLATVNSNGSKDH